MEVSKRDISMYGCIEPESFEDDLVRILSIIEKPSPEEAPSNLAAIGRYVFTPEIFGALRRTTPGVGGEIQLTDAINLLAQEQAVYAYRFEGGRYDVGNPLDYLKATVELAAEREDLGPEFRTWLAEFVQRAKLV
jgi:UTP--glucose-1-phosphate uridylyltransferase